MRVALLTLVVLIAFAGNSILARLALSGGDIGPWSFSLIRFVSGAGVLLILAKPLASWRSGHWGAALALCAYGVFFSYAYLKLATGTGALLLFASVQLTMLIIAFSRGERLRLSQTLGLALAVAGLIYLLSPGLDAPSPIGAVLMAASGIGWGIYSVLGKSEGDPVARTSGNFARAAILLLLATPIFLTMSPESIPAPDGIGLAVLSGTLTSGLGYALWYRVLRDLSVTTASISQLSVPVIAAIGGALLVLEPVTLSFALACATVLIGVGLATVNVRKPS
ncbi:membrane protein [Litorimonas cladophorae]|uniref:Membrane protein n=1 Tax=Litorimonas cladophorae TaxID=1220491 RepID=A0A918KN92_9PROT|nr:DMT family transporter [Litorimonas cladophorae]GGX67473.1 membrane protein [Litorimonas cladophorae]